MDLKMYEEVVPVTLGKKKASLVLKNTNVVLVQSGEIITADIAIENGYIVGVGEYAGEKEIDLTGKYVTPGFVDGHLHLESTMANPQELVSCAALDGTLTFIVDPHEAGNVCGLMGIQYILDQTAVSKADVYVMMPSCVPAIDSEESGFILSAEEMSKFLANERILGLGEVMDCGAVIGCKDTMIDKLRLYKDKINDGHAIGLQGKELSAYAMANIKTDHESITYEQAIEEVRNGMYVHIREGSAAKNLHAIVKGIVEHGVSVDRFDFCTDDKHIEDIEREGHISYNIREAIKLGIKPIDAFKMASLNPATCYKLDEIGMIAVGKKANLVVLSDFENVVIDKVMYEGEWLQKKVFTTEEIKESNRKFVEKYNFNIYDTVHIDWFKKENLEFKSTKYGMEVIPNQLLTNKIVCAETDQPYNKAVVIERHHNTGHYHVAKIYGVGLKKGAIATSVSHDSHNIVVIGANDDDIMVALEELKRVHGGCVVVEDGKVFEVLPLSVMGLISDLSSGEINEKISRMAKKAKEMGINDGIEPFITLSFVALPVIPFTRVTTKGLLDVITQTYLD